MTSFDRYIALALQTRCDAVNGLSRDDARLKIAVTIERIAAQISRCRALLGPDLRLVVLPEYFLTGFPLGDTIGDWASAAAIASDSAEMTALCRIAQDNGLFLSGNAYETDPHFDGLYFQCCFVIDPAGNIVLRYRRMISLYAPTPYDVWDAYLDRYGTDSIFPVVDTAIGRLAAIASEEILYPEIARLAALQGAEVLLHNSAEFGSAGDTAKDICRRARAVENSAYLVSANSAGIADALDIPVGTTDSMSKIIDPRGLILASAGYGETMAAHADIDLAALRHARARPGMANMLSRVPVHAIGEAYARVISQSPNGLLAPGGAVKVPDRSWFGQRQAQVIAARIATPDSFHSATEESQRL